MSDLSEALTDAAARRIAASDVLDRDMNAFDTECEWAEQQYYLRMGRDAVAAVLETLADQCPSPNGWWLTLEELRQVAAEAKGEEGR